MAPASAYTDKRVEGSSNAFADAISQFIEEVRDEEDKKSRFYKEVMLTAGRLRLSPEPADQSLFSAEDLSHFVKEIELQHGRKSFTRRVFKSLQPLVDGLLQYTNAVDTMIQADPTAGALIYGGAKLVLQLASGYSRYFEKISEMMADIGDSLMCFHIYSTEFAANEKMNSILIRSYKDILNFWREASKILDQRGGARIFIRGLLTPFEASYGKFKEKLDRNTRLVDSIAQALNIQDQGNFRRAQAVNPGAAQEVIKSLERASSFPREEQGQTTTKREAIRRWIAGGRSSRIDPANDLERHLASRHVGTCEWIFQDLTFKHWRTSGKDDVLWLNAAPGAGKSVLSSAIIDRLKNTDKQEHRNVLYFFCRFDDPEKCRAISVLRSIALQALKLIKYIPDDLYQLYLEEYSIDDEFVATPLVATKVVEYLLKRIEHVYIVIDGLCECQDGSLSDMLIRLSQIKGLGVTKWLFTSRNELEICRKFEGIGAETMSVSKTVVEKDIRKFLEDNVDLLFGTEDQLDRLTKLSEGNFLGIRLTIDPIREDDVTCEEEFEETLKSFQPELGRCWYRSLKKLTRRKETIQDLARTIFNAVALAVQSMTLNELADMLTIEIDKEPSPGRQRKKTVILSACTPFIELDYGDDYLNPTVRMAHKTVGEFLCQDPTTLDFVDEDCYKFFVKLREGNLEIGQKCLTYLSYKRYSSPEDLTVLANFQKITQEHPFLAYAAIFWHRHLDQHGGNKEVYERIRDFLQSPNIWTCIRVQSTFAPHLLATLSYDCKHDNYKMHSPDNPNVMDDPEHAYYADALPTWIHRYDNVKDCLVWGYHMFVREWGEILIRHPQSIQYYFAKVLGRRSFWSTKQCSNEAVQIYALNLISSRQKISLSKSLFDLTKTSLKANFGILNEIPNMPVIVLEEWQLSLGSGSSHDAPKLTYFDHVHLRRIQTPVTITSNLHQPPSPSPTPACLNLIAVDKGIEEERQGVNGKPTEDLQLWTVQPGHPALSDHNTINDDDDTHKCEATKEPGLTKVFKILIADVLEQRQASVYERAQKTSHLSQQVQVPKSIKDIDTLQEMYTRGEIFGYYDKQSIVEGELTATIYQFRTRNDSSDDFNNSAEDSEDSDDDSDIESEEVASGDLKMRILSVTKGNEEPHWYWHVSKDHILKDALPLFDMSKACLLWPRDKSSLLIVDIAKWNTSIVTLPDHKYKKHRLVTQSYHLSTQSGILHQAIILVNNTRFATIMQSFFTFSYTALGPSSAKLIPAINTKQETTWQIPSIGLTEHNPFSWVDDTLYAALGSLEITVLRFPPPPSPQAIPPIIPPQSGEPKIQSLTKFIFLPATASSRGLHVFAYLDPSTLKPHALFCLNALPALELPPVVLDFNLEKSCGPWKEYHVSQENESAASQNMKGIYAAKDRAFSVPIRSGLEWRKSTYVTCW